MQAKDTDVEEICCETCRSTWVDVRYGVGFGTPWGRILGLFPTLL